MVERFEPVWRAEISRAMNEMIDAYAVTGSVPHLPDDHERRLSDIWQDMTLIAINAFGGRIVEDGLKGFSPYTFDNGATYVLAAGNGNRVETKSFSEFFQRLALEFVQSEMIRQRIVGIAGTLRRQITTIIADGQQGGQTLPDIVKALRAMEPAISINRARIISRTEIHGASNYGAHEAAKATGLTLRKEWVSVEDYRTRSFDNPDGPAEFSHRAMNGVIVDMDTAFDVPRNDGTTEPMMTPGDPMGSAGNVINCRCQVAHVVID